MALAVPFKNSLLQTIGNKESSLWGKSKIYRFNIELISAFITGDAIG